MIVMGVGVGRLWRIAEEYRNERARRPGQQERYGRLVKRAFVFSRNKDRNFMIGPANRSKKIEKRRY